MDIMGIQVKDARYHQAWEDHKEASLLYIGSNKIRNKFGRCGRAEQQNTYSIQAIIRIQGSGIHGNEHISCGRKTQYTHNKLTRSIILESKYRKLTDVCINFKKVVEELVAFIEIERNFIGEADLWNRLKALSVLSIVAWGKKLEYTNTAVMEEKRMKNRIERKRRLKENVSLEDGISVQN